ncbi:hypothetical protein STSP2_00325 [Anaerohalosphaera lusitana]|uniref:Uncharacterized protein n=1 Tax=Anaerohalosphaera lusitana TaxID=1936003 RepID=A0A1U9NGX2_9BACT|nr:hypothetical protein [Anaerohalosphaera lusitana]AQT67182.1 hypothetical protein STSP2_00325 [Anaerohalosphaera lusitana]
MLGYGYITGLGVRIFFISLVLLSGGVQVLAGESDAKGQGCCATESEQCGKAGEKAWRVVEISDEVREERGLDEWYRKMVDVDGFTVAGSERVSDMALQEAAFIIDKMLTGLDDVRDAMIRTKVKCAVMAVDEFTTMVPEHATLEPADYWNRRARGLGAIKLRPAVSCGEENLLAMEGDPYRTQNILIHEFAHSMHLTGLSVCDRSFDTKLLQAHKGAVDEGLWKGTYAGKNHLEYWAVGVQCWFDTAGENDHVSNEINTREELREYDPRLYAMVKDVFGESQWKYSPPAERAGRGHLKDYDRSKLAKFEWPKRYDHVVKDIDAETAEIQGKE